MSLQKKILINGAGRGCFNLIKTANAMGLYTIVTGMEGPCIPLANKAYREVHPGHPEEVLKVAKGENVDAVVTCCNDMGLESVGYCCDSLNLCGLSRKAAQASSNKLLLKELLVNNNVRTARFCKIRNKDELNEAATNIHFPLIVKATDLQGSRGITIVRKEDDLDVAFDEAMSLTHKDYCIVEEFIEGKEFGAQAFVYKGEVLFVLPHGDDVFIGKTAVPIGHYMPYEINDDLRKDIEKQAIGAIKAVGLDNCAVNIDFIEKDNKAYIIELTGRGGANGLTDITGRYFGINYYEMIIQMALGNDPREVFSKRLSVPKASKSTMIKSNVSGKVHKLIVPSIDNVEINMFIHEGDSIRSFTNCNDAIGEIFVQGENLEKCENLVNESLANIKVEME